jgi:hypothetical protein
LQQLSVDCEPSITRNNAYSWSGMVQNKALLARVARSPGSKLELLL